MSSEPPVASDDAGAGVRNGEAVQLTNELNGADLLRQAMTLAPVYEREDEADEAADEAAEEREEAARATAAADAAPKPMDQVGLDAPCTYFPRCSPFA